MFSSLRGTVAAPTSTAPEMASVVVTSDARYLLLRRSSVADGLFRVRLADRQVSQVDLHGATVPGGSGMVLTNSNVLYVDGFTDNTVLELRLSENYRQGRRVSLTHSDNVSNPSGMALAGDRILVGNFGSFPGRPPFVVTSIPLP